MPLYEFTCSTCGLNFERSLLIGKQESEVRCPSGHRRVRRVYSAPLIRFKGSGFYTTDHPLYGSAGEGKS